MAAFVVAGLAACGGGAGSVLSTMPASHSRGSESLVGSASNVTATLIQPLTFTYDSSSNVATVGLYGTAQCGPGGGTFPNWCPGTNFTGASWTPSSSSPASILATMGSSVLANTTCTAPAAAPAPAPGFTPGCYVVAVENGSTGPFLIQGPAAASGGGLSFQASPTTLSLDGETAYYFFLAYVTAIAPQPTPTPFVPIAPPATAGASASPSPTACPTSDDDGLQRGKHGIRGMHKHHGGDDDGDCESDDD